MNTTPFQAVPPVPADTYEPKCLERWAESQAGADDMSDFGVAHMDELKAAA
jgi:hypothetical protein